MLKQIKDFLLLTAGTLIVAIGIYFFKFPNNFCTGGVSGISVILGSLAIINVALLIIGFLFVGRGFGLKTAYCSLLLSAAVYVLERTVNLTAPMTTQPILELVFAILFPAIGSALLFNEGASTGGTDIIAMIIKKYADINISKALFYADCVIVMLTFFVFGVETWLFSLIGFVAKILFVNNVIDSINLSKYCTVITSPEYESEICDYITNHLHKTATVNNTYTGAYNHDRKTVLLAALTVRQAASLKKFVKSIDEKSFIIVNNTSEICGRGFHETV